MIEPLHQLCKTLKDTELIKYEKISNIHTPLKFPQIFLKNPQN